MNHLLRWVTRMFHERLVDFRYGTPDASDGEGEEGAQRMAAWEVVVDRMQRVGREPARERLARLAEQAVRVGSSSGRGPITVCIDDDGASPDPDRWTPIWATLLHAVRAAVNEGLEGQAARVAVGKPARGYLWLRAFERDGRVVVEVEDDGRGVPPEIPELRAAVQAAGGEVSVQAVPGFGSLIRLEVPTAPPSSRARPARTSVAPAGPESASASMRLAGALR